MKKEYFLYPLFFILALVGNVAVAYLVPPIYAMCDCLFNDIKTLSITVFSSLGAIAVVLLTRRKHSQGVTYKKAFIKSLFPVMGMIALIGIANLIFFSDLFM